MFCELPKGPNPGYRLARFCCGQAPSRNWSRCRSQLVIRFQLTLVWSTILRSRELPPKRELRLGEPCEGCRAVAAEPRRRAENSHRVRSKQSQRLPPFSTVGRIPAHFHVDPQTVALPSALLVPGDKRFVYVLKNPDHAPNFSVGLTSDVSARVSEHNAGRCPHTASRRPWRLHVVIEFSHEKRAVRFERSRTASQVASCPDTPPEFDGPTQVPRPYNRTRSVSSGLGRNN